MLEILVVAGLLLTAVGLAVNFVQKKKGAKG